MDVTLSVLASLYTLYVQSTMLESHEEYKDFKPVSQYEEPAPTQVNRRTEIIEASLKRQEEILESNRVISQTYLNNR